MPDRGRRLSLALVGAGLALAACGGEPAPDGDGAGGTPPPAQTSVTVRAGLAEPFTLEPGRYRFSWDAPGCAAPDFSMVGATSGFTYAKSSALPKFTAIVSNVPRDTYEITQADEACTEWSVTLDRIGG
jgi:hypothetical protein